MAEDLRRVGVYGVGGVLVAALIIAGIIAVGIRLPSLAFHSGTLVVKLTDAPVELERLNLTIGSVDAQRVENGEETWGDLSFVDDLSEFRVDNLLELSNVTRDLSITEIPPGNYTKLRMSVTKAEATYIGGDTVELTVPPGHIDIIIHFEIKAGETTRIIVDMQADWVAISQSQTLRPVLKATLDSGK